MKQFAFGGAGSVPILRPRSGNTGRGLGSTIRIGSGISTKYFVKINGECRYLWRAVDHEGEVLECFVSKRRNRKAALKFLRKTMKRFSRPEVVVTDKLTSYRAALRDLASPGLQRTDRWMNNRAENSHQPFRRRETAMLKFRRTHSLQKFVSVHASLHNHFNHQSHLISRNEFRKNRDVSLAEWRELGVA